MKISLKLLLFSLTSIVNIQSIELESFAGFKLVKEFSIATTDEEIKKYLEDNFGVTEPKEIYFINSGTGIKIYSELDKNIIFLLYATRFFREGHTRKRIEDFIKEENHNLDVSTHKKLKAFAELILFKACTYQASLYPQFYCTLITVSTPFSFGQSEYYDVIILHNLATDNFIHFTQIFAFKKEQSHFENFKNWFECISG